MSTGNLGKILLAPNGGLVGVGFASPQAILDIRGGTAAVNTAAGTVLNVVGGKGGKSTDNTIPGGGGSGISITAGAGGDSANLNGAFGNGAAGGTLTLQSGGGGNSNGTGGGGAATLQLSGGGGEANGSSGTGGSITLTAGNSSWGGCCLPNLGGGSITLQPGSGTPAGVVAIQGNSALQLGYGVGGQEANAGKIAYEQFTNDSLDIVGAGTTAMNRKIKFFAEGGANFTGPVTKASGSFKIDHPLDPANKYLYHSFVESPDMMNIYNGAVILDRRGQAWVNLPEWFEALNRDFRYQLTAIGAPGPNLYVAREIEGHRFKIAGGKPGLKVSWQVTGIRQDPYAEAHRIPVEQEKPAGEQGYYLHPDVYGQPKEKGIEYADRPLSPRTPAREHPAALMLR